MDLQPVAQTPSPTESLLRATFPSRCEGAGVQCGFSGFPRCFYQLTTWGTLGAWQVLPFPPPQKLSLLDPRYHPRPSSLTVPPRPGRSLFWALVLLTVPEVPKQTG